jgi:Lrp/AsnC family transcriptional regulator for asnA, asnC and gidA
VVNGGRCRLSAFAAAIRAVASARVTSTAAGWPPSAPTAPDRPGQPSKVWTSVHSRGDQGARDGLVAAHGIGGHDARVRTNNASQQQQQPAPVLDEVAKRIIEQLQQDGRRSYGAIGKVVGLSEAAVRQRVQRLTQSGLMQIVAVTDPMRVGLFRQAMIAIKVDGPLEPVAEVLGAMDEIDYVIICAGRYDLLCEAVCEDDSHLLDLLSHRIRVIPGVRDVETLIYLKLHKQSYQWGAR